MTDPVAKQFAFACMRDMATQTVMDFPLYGPETLCQMLNAYQDRFCLVEDLVRHGMRRGGNLRGPHYRHRTRRRRSLLMPPPKRGIVGPITTPPIERVVHVITNGGSSRRSSCPRTPGTLRQKGLPEEQGRLPL